MEWAMLRFPPAFGDKNWFPVEGGWGYAVTAATKYPQQAWEFVAYAGNYENQRDIQLESAMLPTRVEAFKGEGDPEYLKEPYGRWNRPMFDVLPHGKPVAWFIMNQTEFDDLVKTGMDRIYHDELSIEQGLQDLEDQVNAMIVKKWEPYGGVPPAKK
jgi:ABC-type glycerol-3-phosphate transport system substrate-binding protein